MDFSSYIHEIKCKIHNSYAASNLTFGSCRFHISFVVSSDPNYMRMFYLQEYWLYWYEPHVFPGSKKTPAHPQHPPATHTYSATKTHPPKHTHTHTQNTHPHPIKNACLHKTLFGVHAQVSYFSMLPYGKHCLGYRVQYSIIVHGSSYLIL